MRPVPPPAELVAKASPRHAALVLGTLDASGTEQHVGGRQPPDPDALFMIGSVTKTFTALALARQVVRGSLTLDDTVGRLLPDGTALATGVADITLGQLATHTSGLPRLPPGLWTRALRRDADPYADIDEARLLRALGEVRLRRTRRPRYSNLGFGLLGHLLARAGATTYAGLVEAEVARPLGLADTVVTPSPAQRERVVAGHTRRLRPRRVEWGFDALAGAGALWSTAPDLLSYAAAHLDPPAGELGEALELVLRPQVSHRGATYALAWMVLPALSRVDGVFHNGAVHGYRSVLVLDPAQRRAAVALSATDRSVDGLGLQALLGAGQDSAGTAAT